MTTVLEVEDDDLLEGTRVVRSPRIMRQKSRRYPLVINVARYDGQRGHWRSMNVSEGGCFVVGEPLLDPSEELEIGLWLANGQDELITRARVAWVNTQDKPRAKNLPVGMGL